MTNISFLYRNLTCGNLRRRPETCALRGFIANSPLEHETRWLASRPLPWAKRFAGTVWLTVKVLISIAAISFLLLQIMSSKPVMMFFMHELPFRGQIFDPQQWSDAGSCAGLSDWQCAAKQGSCPRGQMVRNLLRKCVLVADTTRDTEIALLGAKEYDVVIHGTSCDAYRLGMCSGLRIDYDSLYVCYAEDDVVSATGHIQH